MFQLKLCTLPGGSEGSMGGICPLAVLELPALPDPAPRRPEDEAIEDELRAFVRVEPVPELINGLLLSGI